MIWTFDFAWRRLLSIFEENLLKFYSKKRRRTTTYLSLGDVCRTRSLMHAYECVVCKCKHHMPIARFQALPNHWLNIMISNWLRHILMATWHAICSAPQPKHRRVCCVYKIYLAGVSSTENPMPKLEITLWMQQQQQQHQHHRNANIIDAFDGPNHAVYLSLCCGWRSTYMNRMRCRSTEIGL